MTEKALLARFGIAVTLLAVVGFVLFKYAVGNSIGSDVQEPTPVAAKPSDPPPKEPKARQQRHTQAKSEPKVVSYQPVAVYEEKVPVPPFPSANDVQPGLSRAELVRTFGVPDVAVVSTGRERLLYLGRNQATSVTVQNGITAASRTDNFDARGASIQLHPNP